MEESVYRTYLLPIVLGLLPLVLNFCISSLRKRKEEIRQLRYLVVRVASTLEAFSLDSFNLFVSYQLHCITSGKVGTSDKGVPCELLEFPSDVDWQVLDAKLVNEILSFPNRLKIGQRQVEYSKQRYEEEDFERFRYECLTQLYETGQEAWELAKKLREQVNIQCLDHGDLEDGWQAFGEVMEQMYCDMTMSSSSGEKSSDAV